MQTGILNNYADGKYWLFLPTITMNPAISPDTTKTKVQKRDKQSSDSKVPIQ